MQFLFNKEKMLELLIGPTVGDTVFIDLVFSGKEGDFIATITAKVGNLPAPDFKGEATVKGCPNPPGCG